MAQRGGAIKTSGRVIDNYTIAYSKITDSPVWLCYPSPSMSPLLPHTSEYKKAQRQYLKATKNRPINNDWTPFRAAEKRFKSRFPPLDLTDVLDFAAGDDARADEISQGHWKGSPNAIEYKSIPLKGERSPNARAYTILQIPGAHLLQ